MPDLTMCTSTTCDKRQRCHRCTAKPSVRQVYFGVSLVANECEFFIDNSGRVDDNSGNDEEKQP